MSGKSTKSGSPASTRRDRTWLQSSGERGIDYSDIPPIPESVLRRARLAVPATKVRITTSIDADVLAWLKRGGPRYQTRLNTILRQVMGGQPGAPSSTRRRKSA